MTISLATMSKFQLFIIHDISFPAVSKIDSSLLSNKKVPFMQNPSKLMVVLRNYTQG